MPFHCNKQIFSVIFILLTSIELKTCSQGMQSRSKVAICGSGISGCYLAHLLQASGSFDVSIFEVGRGAGGRSSSRRHSDFAFDHGAQAIKSIKTEAFQRIVSQWEAEGVLAQWSPRISHIPSMKGVSLPSPYYVGVPAMSAICKHLISSNQIKKVFNCQVAPMRRDDRWQVAPLNKESISDAVLADNVFDYLVIADR